MQDDLVSTAGSMANIHFKDEWDNAAIGHSDQNAVHMT